MRFRTLALALAVSCGMAGIADARHKSGPQPRKVKPYRAKRAKAHKVKHSR